MKVPCKLCVVYASCKTKETIKCDKLYNYVRKTNRFPQRILPNTIEIGEAKGITFFPSPKHKAYTIKSDWEWRYSRRYSK